MLYKNDNEEESYNQYVLDYDNNKLNVKKVAGVISAVLIFAIILVGAIFLTLNRSIDKNKISTIENEENNIETENIIATNVKIEPHSGQKIMDSFLPQENPNAQDEIKAKDII